MNNINCEHCGSVINVESDNNCPNCGAPYKNNKQYKEYLEYLKKQKEVNLESQKANTEFKSGVFKVFKTIFSGIAIYTVITLIVTLFVFFSIFKSISNSIENEENNFPKQDDVENNFPKPGDIINDNQDSEENKITSALFNETVNTDKYNIKVNEIKKYKDELFTDNKTYYAFNIVFKNKGDEWQTLSFIKLVYIDNEGDEQYAKRGNVPEKQLTSLATEKQTYEGYIYYDIPSYVKDVKLVYDNIEITMNNFKNYIK